MIFLPLAGLTVAGLAVVEGARMLWSGQKEKKALEGSWRPTTVTGEDVLLLSDGEKGEMVELWEEHASRFLSALGGREATPEEMTLIIKGVKALSPKFEELYEIGARRAKLRGLTARDVH